MGGSDPTFWVDLAIGLVIAAAAVGLGVWVAIQAFRPPASVPTSQR